jgi:hypothetical protein
MSLSHAMRCVCVNWTCQVGYLQTPISIVLPSFGDPRTPASCHAAPALLRHLDHNLPNMVARNRVIIRLLELLERKHLVDNGPELRQLERSVHLLGLFAIAYDNRKGGR